MLIFYQFPYPCIGMFTFLDLDLPLLPCYDEIVSRVKRGDTFLDLGCCFGQEIRQLVSSSPTYYLHYSTI